ncbi:MAG: hypothetical protein FJ278_18630, partial [Planctomycetes bacterium]|nr:hypothetical protein [Planctomycetota bacterium]
MRGWEAVLGVILVSVWGAAGYGALSVTEDAGKVTVQSEHYAVTFDKAKGGRITQLGSRAVTQSDSADGYALGGDGKAEVTVSREDAERVEVKVRAYYVKNGQKPPSEMDAEYRYLFDGRSRLARCKATITQREVQFFADVYGYPHWQKVSILDLGSEAGWRGSFGGRSKSVTVHFTPGAAKALDVSPEEAKSFDALVAPRIARQARLMDERFEAKSRWYDVCGAWTLETGALLSRSPQGSAAWTVAGETDWKDYIVETDVRTRDGSSHVFLCGRWQDMGNHYELQHLEHPVFAMRIVRVRGGERVTLAEVVGVPDLRTLPGTKLGLEVNGNRLRAYREGEMVLEAYDSAFRAGRVALGVASQDSVWFQRVDVFAVEPAKGDVPSAMLREPVQRHAFYRDEKAAQIAFIVVAQSPGDGLAANFALESVRYPTRGESERKVIPLGALKAGEEREVRFGLQPHLWRSGDYLLTATVTQGALTLARE